MEDVKKWVQKQSKKGYSKKQIIQKLKSSGYSDEQIDNIFNSIEKKVDYTKLISFALILISFAVVLFFVKNQFMNDENIYIESDTNKYKDAIELVKTNVSEAFDLCLNYEEYLGNIPCSANVICEAGRVGINTEACKLVASNAPENLKEKIIDGCERFTKICEENDIEKISNACKDNEFCYLLSAEMKIEEPDKAFKLCDKAGERKAFCECLVGAYTFYTNKEKAKDVFNKIEPGVKKECLERWGLDESEL